MSDAKLLPFIEGAKGGGHTPVQDPDSLRSTAKGRVVDLLAEGEIVGLIDGAKSIFFDETPLMAADGSYNFSNVSYDIRYGLPQQDPLTGFDSVETEVGVGREVTVSTSGGKPGPYEFTLTDSQLDAVRVTIRIPALVQQTDEGDVLKTSVGFMIEVKAGTGAFQPVIQDVVYGKTTAGYERSYRINLPKPATNWTVRVTRQTADSTSEKLQNSTYVSSYTKIIDAKLIYPDSAVVGVSLDAGSFGGQIPVRGYHVKGRKIKVPANYDPETRTYATTGAGTTNGYWNGTLKTAYSNNPAWVLYDILDNDRFGLGQFIDNSQIDKYSLYAIGQYCDQMVDDGMGGQEPRFTLNCAINDRVEAYNLIQSIASNFRAMAFWSVGAITAVQDSPKDPVQLVTPANVVGGEFNYQSTGLKDRHTVVLVTWNDPDDFYKAAVEAVENPEGIKRYGYRPTDVYAFGCTSRGQAHRLGRWLLETEYSEKEAVSYTASIDHIAALPGQIIAIADPTKSGTRTGGRIAGGTTTAVILDNPITVAAGDYLSVTLNDGTVATVALTPNATASTTVIPVTALPETPTIGNVWVLYGGTVKQRLYRIISLSERENNLFEVQAVAYDPDKFARVEQDLAFDPIIRDPTFTERVLPPLSLSVMEGIYYVNNQVRSRLLLSWAAPDSYVASYEVRSTSPSGAISQWNSTDNTYFEVPDAELGAYTFEVRSVGVNGSRSTITSLDYTVLGKAAPPGKPTALTATAGIRQVALSWTNPTDIDLAYIEVFANTTNVQSTATKIGSIMGTTFLHPNLTAGQPYYYWVRAVDSSGNIGDFNAASGVTATPASDITTTTTPANVAGLTLTTSLTVLADGSTQVKLVANWSPAADASYYEVEIKEGAGSYVGYQASTTTYEWIVKPNTSYTVRVRGVSQYGVKSAGYSTASTLTSAGDSTAPAVPTGLTITSSLRSAFLAWTNTSDLDLAEVEIWVGSTNNSASATRVAVVNAAPGAPGGFTHSGLTTGSTYYYWLKSVDTSGNVSGFNTGATAGTAVTVGSVANGDIAAGTINADRIAAGTLTGDRISTTTSLPATITVGTSGVSIDTVRTNAATGAQDPATRINANSTTIDPGKILISGSTTLSNWRNGSDLTKIEGGSIAANTISANQVTIGLRGIDIAGIEFEAQKTGANILSWSAGTISYVNDSGVAASSAITAATVTWSAATVYVYWVKGATELSTTTTQSTAYGADRIVLATYRGGIDLVVNYGRTIIDGSQITTGTVNANTLKSGTAITNMLYVGANGRIVLDGPNNEIYQLPATGSVKIFQSTAAGVTLRKSDGTVILDSSGGVNTSALGLGSLAYQNSVAYSNVSGTPTSLSGINSTEGSKLSGIEAGATVGATIGTNLSGQINSSNVGTYIANLTVDTLRIANNAVTMPVGASVGSATIGNGTNTLISATITTSGGPVFIAVSGYFSYYSSNSSNSANVQVLRDGTNVRYLSMPSGSQQTNLTFVAVENLPAGTYTYSFVFVGNGASGGFYSGNCNLPSIFLLETKK